MEDTAEKIDSGNAPFATYTNGYSLYYGYGRVNVLKVARAISKKDGAEMSHAFKCNVVVTATTYLISLFACNIYKKS